MIRHRYSKSFILIVLFPLLVSCASSNQAQQAVQSSQQEEEIHNLIVQLPAESEAEHQHIFNELASFGPEGIRTLTNMLIPAGIGDDTYARYAVNGLAKHLSRQGAGAKRHMFEDVLLEKLASGTSRATKTFLMEQLALCGSDHSVPVLEVFLADHTLYDPAVQTLTAIGTSQAEQALRRNIATTDGTSKATIVKALGDLQATSAAGDILPLASEENSNIKHAALYTLARLGQPGAGEVLEGAIATSDSQWRTQARSLQLTYARRLAEEGYIAQSNEIARKIFNNLHDAHIKGAALRLLVDNGADDAPDVLLNAAVSEDNQLRGIALSIAGELDKPISTRIWLEKLEQSPPQIQADIIDMLGRSKDDSTVSDIVPFLNHESIEVRLAAIEAYTLLAGEAALPNLINRLKQSTEKRETDALKTVLLRMPTQNLTEAAASALPEASDQTKPVLIRLLASRQAKSYLNEVIEYSQHSSPEVRLAAFQALESLGSPENLPALIDLLIRTRENRDRELVGQAVVTILKEIENPQERIESVLATLNQANGSAKVALLQLLPKIGGSQALSALADATASAEPGVREAAIETLAQWPEPSAIPALLEVFETSSGTDTQEVANGLIRLIPSSLYSAEDKVRWLNRIADLAPSPGEKTAAISALASLQSPMALNTVAAYLTHSDPEVSQAAVQGVAAMLASSGNTTGNLSAEDGVLSVLETTVSPQLRNRVEQELRRIRTNEREADEFTPLFNGRNLSGWTGATEAYFVEDGKIISRPDGSGNLFTENQYSDFVLRFEFKLTEGANNGLGIRAALDSHAAYEAMELQILDDTSDKYANLHPYQFHGSVYGVVPARRGYLNPVGEWNTQEVIARGSHITVKLNGTTIVDADVIEAAKPEPMDGREHPGLERSSGHIGLLGHNSRVEFRNIRIKDLTQYSPDYSVNSDELEGLNQPPEGFKALFNGESLSGWKGLVGNPESRAGMSPQELSRKQAKADSLMRAHWSVRDGILYFDGEGSHLCTIEEYGDFEMLLDWKIEPGGDSGVYLRGTPQVQIWDPTEWLEGSGGLYNNQQHPSSPLTLADNPIGEWNHMRIKMIGERVTVHLNGELVVSDVVLENYWDRSQPIYPVGQIELQSHSTPLYFRNIFIREIPRTKELFNGKDLTGWQRVGENSGEWNVDARGILFTQGGGGGWLSTDRMYDNFTLKLEYRLPEGGNSGVFLRAPQEGNPAYAGMEIQLLDDEAEQYNELRPWQYTGSIYDVQAPSKRASKGPGQWQQMTIVANGPSVKVSLNGERILNANLANHMDRTEEHPGLKRRRGYIGLQNHNTRVEFRNITLTEMK